MESPAQRESRKAGRALQNLAIPECAMQTHDYVSVTRPGGRQKASISRLEIPIQHGEARLGNNFLFTCVAMRFLR